MTVEGSRIGSPAPAPHLAEPTVEGTHRVLVQRLLARRVGGSGWRGELSSSALSTATALVALELARRAGRGATGDRRLLEGGAAWLAAHQRSDGGWGDTVRSGSNISTTCLAWAALHLTGLEGGSLAAAEAWLEENAGGVTAPALQRAVLRRYGKDQTFSVPILTVLALAGRLGSNGWRRVPQLPFELAALPQAWFRWLDLRVVSYALPALIAIGLVRHHQRPSKNPVSRLLRRLTARRTLGVLDRIQPPNGGFLEAVPLTSFVLMSLLAAERQSHPVVGRGLAFIRSSTREDGSWPIDTNLTTWLTTLSLKALAASAVELAEAERRELLDWLLEQQYRSTHAYTGAPPGGWAWTDLPGGVPDADDTAGALLALDRLGVGEPAVERAAAAGVQWLLDLQNRDGGVPTFCRGWGKLPFDRSGADLTAHALRVWIAWRSRLPELRGRLSRAVGRGLRYLERTQRQDGSWLPLWFGNEAAPGEENPTYGTAQVLLALGALQASGVVFEAAILERGVAWLLGAQGPEGGWGGAPGVAPSLEETGLALEALAAVDTTHLGCAGLETALAAGAQWVAGATAGGLRTEPAPIGFYFAKLWYFEELYPLIFAAGGLGRVLGREPRTDRQPTPT